MLMLPLQLKIYAAAHKSRPGVMASCKRLLPRTMLKWLCDNEFLFRVNFNVLRILSERREHPQYNIIYICMDL